jgi:hypothetical protein
MREPNPVRVVVMVFNLAVVMHLVPRKDVFT